MNRIAIKTIILFVFFAFAATISAQVNTLYYMKTVSTRYELNPAFQPLSDIHVQVPVLSGFYIAGGNNALVLHDVFYPAPGGKTVNFLNPDYGDKNKFYNLLKTNTHLFGELQFDLLGGGFRVKETDYITFGISEKVSVNSVVPKDFFKLMLYGMPDTININRFNFSSFNVNANVYTELACGYSHKMDDKLMLGGKAKFLVGQANINTASNNLILETSREKWTAHMDSEANMTLPRIDYVLDDDGKIDFTKTDFNNANYFIPAGLGVAVDAGASYYLLDNRLHLSASALDLGFIQWVGSQTIKMKADGDFDFEGTTIEMDKNGNVNWGNFEEVLNNFHHSIEYKVSPGKTYTTWLPAKVMLGAEYGLMENKITFGLLSKTTVVNKRLYEEITTSANFLPTDKFNASISYSCMNGRLSNFGLGIGGCAGPINLYLAGDYIPLRYSRQFFPTHTQQFNLKFGIVLNFRYKGVKNIGQTEEPYEML